VSLLAAMVALAAGSAFAADKKPTDSGAQAPATQNPYSPAYGHSYRHGVIPTIDTLKQMRAWEATNGHAGIAAANSPTLSYGGGTSGVGVGSGQVKVYLVFWGTQWGTQSTDSNGNLTFSGDSYGAAAKAQMMFKGIGTGGETWSADLTQWCEGVASGSTSCPSSTPAAQWVPYQQNAFAGAWYDNSAAAPSAATAAQIGNEATKAAGHFGNTTAASNRYAYYVILSPHGTNPDNYQGQYCAWHDYSADAGSTTTYGQLAFSNQPYNMDSGSGCGVGFVNSGTAGNLDGWTMTLGHEWHETMSDFYPAGGWTNHNTGTYAGQENSDECAWIAAGQTGGAANVTMGNGTYTEQASWSNDTNSCAISHSILTHGSSGGTPTANFTFSTSGLTANFTDTSTDSGGTITGHSWTFGDSGTSTATNPSHTYASGGTYSVTETVTDSASGKTSSKTSSVTVASTGGTPSANFTFTTSGLTANFTDTSTDSGGTIGSHSWNFGDSATSTATSPSHTYAAAGTYSVTETVTDSVNGTSSSKSSNVTVSNVTTQQLLANTGFESTASWTASSGVICATGCSGESAHGGSGFAWMDGYGSAHTDTLSQTVTVPSGKSTGTLSFYLHIDTAETTTTTAYDKLTVTVGSTTVATFSNLNKNTGYAVHSYNVPVTAGSSVTVKFSGVEDSSLQTSFVVDDVTFTVQ